MTAVRPPLAPLAGRGVILEPMGPEHDEGLYRALARPEVFAGGWGGGPAGLVSDPAGFAAWMARYYSAPPRGTSTTRFDFVVRARADDGSAGEVLGATTLGDFDEAAGSAHIGWTAYAPEVWGTRVNPECKLLLLGLAFDAGYERVKLQADAVNARSRAAIAKLGAVFEGVLRHDRPRADGSWRDTAVYSILREEWPAVRAGLEARLAGD
ncbi:MAG: GNAT family N-acetyltransferase [Actinomycetales bacterium]|nr:GNAT family N-acetyltransferase [Actinomycetales bacterium]